MSGPPVKMGTVTMSLPDDLIERTEYRRIHRASRLIPDTRVNLGQYFTPAAAADLIASMPDLPAVGRLRVLDPGAGVGSLTAAVVARAARERPDLKLVLSAFEIDQMISLDLAATLADCADAHPVTIDQRGDDFLLWCVDALTSGQQPQWDLIVMNPPYRKIHSSSLERRMLARLGINSTNMYTAFVALCLRVLAPKGQLVAITPRSFANGTYFRPFRRDLLQRTAIQRLHVFDRRNTIFADADVLQENIVFHVAAGAKPSHVTVSSSRGYHDAPVQHTVPYAEVINPDDPHQFLHIATTTADLDLANRLANLPTKLSDLEIRVSTGRVVDFRTKENLRANPDKTTVPLLYPGHLSNGRVRWPLSTIRKPNALAVNEATESLMLPAGAYVLVKRFTSKEEPRRVSAALLLPEDLPHRHIAVENHLNVYHANGRGLDPEVAMGLSAYLNSQVVDRFIRLFNGHTQINAGDLRSLRYPSILQLRELGRRVRTRVAPGQVDVDVQQVVPTLEEGGLR
jgi:adenine-specific DNA-methyltransferase